MSPSLQKTSLLRKPNTRHKPPTQHELAYLTLKYRTCYHYQKVLDSSCPASALPLVRLYESHSCPKSLVTRARLLVGHFCCCSVAKSHLTLCDSMDCRMPGSFVLHYLLDFLKFLSIESAMLSSHLILCSLPSSFAFNSHTSVSSVSSVAESCPTLCDPMNRSTPGLPVHQKLPEFTQTHAHRVSDAIQPSHPLSSPSPPAPNPSQHQGLFQ